jgi:phosphate transport system protein
MTIRSRFERELTTMRDDVLRLASMVDRQLEDAMASLKERDLVKAQAVIDKDHELNDLRYHIEEECLALIALQQPAAIDLRNIIAVMNIILDLERMGDHAAGISTITLRMGGEPPLKPLIDLPRMVDISRNMLKKALDALVRVDINLAKEVIGMDEQVDQLYTQIFRELITFMIEDPRTVTRAMYLLFSAHNVERIADRVTNICERVIFIHTGRFEELA